MGAPGRPVAGHIDDDEGTASVNLYNMYLICSLDNVVFLTFAVICGLGEWCVCAVAMDPLAGGAQMEGRVPRADPQG